MKKILFILLLSVYVATEASAATTGLNLLESVPVQSLLAKNSKESPDIVMVDGYISAHQTATKQQKSPNVTTKKHHSLKKNKIKQKHKQLHKYNQSYDVNAVFLQQQQQANQIIMKSDQINRAAQQVSRDASIQAQKTQELLRAQKAAQASANATISSANQLNQLSMSLQKNINGAPNLESSNNNVIELESVGN